MTPRIDTHAHVFRRDLPMRPGTRYTPRRDAPLDDFLALLGAHGMTHGVITAPSFYGTDNSFLLAALAEARGRLRGTVVVDPSIDDATLSRMDAAGVTGVRLNLYRVDPLPDVEEGAWQALFARLASLRWHVEIFLEGARLPGFLTSVLRTGIDVVLDHFGNPDPALGVACPGFRRVLDAMEAGRTWVKLSAPYRLGGADPAPYARELLAAGGARRLMWGSDWPWTQHEDGMSYERTVGWLHEWVPDAEQRAIVLGRTPWELFRFARPPADATGGGGGTGIAPG